MLTSVAEKGPSLPITSPAGEAGWGRCAAGTQGHISQVLGSEEAWPWGWVSMGLLSLPGPHSHTWGMQPDVSLLQMSPDPPERNDSRFHDRFYLVVLFHSQHCPTETITLFFNTLIVTLIVTTSVPLL